MQNPENSYQHKVFARFEKRNEEAAFLSTHLPNYALRHCAFRRAVKDSDSKHANVALAVGFMTAACAQYYLPNPYNAIATALCLAPGALASYAARVLNPELESMSEQALSSEHLEIVEKALQNPRVRKILLSSDYQELFAQEENTLDIG